MAKRAVIAIAPVSNRQLAEWSVNVASYTADKRLDVAELKDDETFWIHTRSLDHGRAKVHTRNNSLPARVININETFFSGYDAKNVASVYAESMRGDVLNIFRRGDEDTIYIEISRPPREFRGEPKLSVWLKALVLLRLPSLEVTELTSREMSLIRHL